MFSVFSVSLWYIRPQPVHDPASSRGKKCLPCKDGHRFRRVPQGPLCLAIVVVPGLIVFAMHPRDPLNRAVSAMFDSRADKSYVHMLQTLVPIGLRGLFLAALFGAIQSTVNSVLNSTSTVFTLDIYQRWINPEAGDKRLVRVGVISSMVILTILDYSGWIYQSP